MSAKTRLQSRHAFAYIFGLGRRASGLSAIATLSSLFFLTCWKLAAQNAPVSLVLVDPGPSSGDLLADTVPAFQAAPVSEGEGSGEASSKPSNEHVSQAAGVPIRPMFNATPASSGNSRVAQRRYRHKSRDSVRNGISHLMSRAETRLFGPPVSGASQQDRQAMIEAYRRVQSNRKSTLPIQVGVASPAPVFVPKTEKPSSEDRVANSSLSMIKLLLRQPARPLTSNLALLLKRPTLNGLVSRGPLVVPPPVRAAKLGGKGHGRIAPHHPIGTTSIVATSPRKPMRMQQVRVPGKRAWVEPQKSAEVRRTSSIPVQTGYQEGGLDNRISTERARFYKGIHLDPEKYEWGERLAKLTNNQKRVDIPAIIPSQTVNPKPVHLSTREHSQEYGYLDIQVPPAAVVLTKPPQVSDNVSSHYSAPTMLLPETSGQAAQAQKGSTEPETPLPDPKGRRDSGNTPGASGESRVYAPSQRRARAVEAFDWDSEIASATQVILSYEGPASGDQGRWIEFSAADHLPSIGWESALSEVSDVGLLSRNSIATISQLTQVTYQASAGLVIGRMPRGAVVTSSARSERVLYFDGQDSTLLDGPTDAEYFILLNTEPGALVLYLSLPSESGGGEKRVGVFTPVRAGRATYLDLRNPTQQTITGRVLDADSRRPTGIPGLRVSLVGQEGPAARTQVDGTFLLERVTHFGDRPTFVECESTGGVSHRYVLPWETWARSQAATLFWFGPDRLQRWTNQLEGGVSVASGLLVAAVPGIVGSTDSEEALFPSLAPLQESAPLIPEVYTISKDERLLVGQTLGEGRSRFLSVQLPDGLLLSEVTDQRGVSRWSRLLVSSARVVTVVVDP